MKNAKSPVTIPDAVNTPVAQIVLDGLPPSSVAAFSDAREYFNKGGTIREVAAHKADAQGHFYTRCLVWIIQSGINTLPRSDKKNGRPDFKPYVTPHALGTVEKQVLELCGLAWTATERGINPLSCARMDVLRMAGKTKDKKLSNDADGIGEAATGEAATGEAATGEHMQLVAGSALAALMQERETLAMLRAELAKAKPSIKAMRVLVG